MRVLLLALLAACANPVTPSAVVREDWPPLPAGMDVAAFAEMAAPQGYVARWTQAPRLVVEDGIDVGALCEGLSALTAGTYACDVVEHRRGTWEIGAIVVEWDLGVPVRYDCGEGPCIGWAERWPLAGSTITAALIRLDPVLGRDPLVAVHELGHALGYAHVTSRRSVMNPADRNAPTELDRQIARVAYSRGR